MQQQRLQPFLIYFLPPADVAAVAVVVAQHLPTSHIRTIGPSDCPGVFYGHRCRRRCSCSCSCRCRRCCITPRTPHPLNTHHPPSMEAISAPMYPDPGHPGHPRYPRHPRHPRQDIAGPFACTRFRIWASLLLFVHFLSVRWPVIRGQWWPWSFVLERYRYIFLYILFFIRARMQ